MIPVGIATWTFRLGVGAAAGRADVAAERSEKDPPA
jgi:hypothetical protein